LHRLDRDEGRLTEALDAHVLEEKKGVSGMEGGSGGKKAHLDAADSRLLRVDNDSITMPSEYRRDRQPVLLLRRLAQVDDPALDAGESSLEGGKGLLELDFGLLLLLLGAGGLEVGESAGELLVVLSFGLAKKGGKGMGWEERGNRREKERKGKRQYRKMGEKGENRRKRRTRSAASSSSGRRDPSSPS
jgi:hypothetical protein